MSLPEIPKSICIVEDYIEALKKIEYKYYIEDYTEKPEVIYTRLCENKRNLQLQINIQNQLFSEFNSEKKWPTEELKKKLFDYANDLHKFKWMMQKCQYGCGVFNYICLCEKTKLRNKSTGKHIQHKNEEKPKVESKINEDICKVCDTKLNKNDLQCPGCDERLKRTESIIRENKCKVCDTKLNETDSQCPGCDERLRRSSILEKSTKSFNSKTESIIRENKCKVCDTEINETDSQCPGCDERLRRSSILEKSTKSPNSKNKCELCDTSISSNDEVCPGCEDPIKRDKQINESEINENGCDSNGDKERNNRKKPDFKEKNENRTNKISSNTDFKNEGNIEHINPDITKRKEIEDLYKKQETDMKRKEEKSEYNEKQGRRTHIISRNIDSGNGRNIEHNNFNITKREEMGDLNKKQETVTSFNINFKNEGNIEHINPDISKRKKIEDLYKKQETVATVTSFNINSKNEGNIEVNDADMKRNEEKSEYNEEQGKRTDIKSMNIDSGNERNIKHNVTDMKIKEEIGDLNKKQETVTSFNINSKNEGNIEINDADMKRKKDKSEYNEKHRKITDIKSMNIDSGNGRNIEQIKISIKSTEKDDFSEIQRIGINVEQNDSNLRKEEEIGELNEKKESRIGSISKDLKSGNEGNIKPNDADTKSKKKMSDYTEKQKAGPYLAFGNQEDSNPSNVMENHNLNEITRDLCQNNKLIFYDQNNDNIDRKVILKDDKSINTEYCDDVWICNCGNVNKSIGNCLKCNSSSYWRCKKCDVDNSSGFVCKNCNAINENRKFNNIDKSNNVKVEEKSKQIEANIEEFKNGLNKINKCDEHIKDEELFIKSEEDNHVIVNSNKKIKEIDKCDENIKVEKLSIKNEEDNRDISNSNEKIEEINKWMCNNCQTENDGGWKCIKCDKIDESKKFDCTINKKFTWKCSKCNVSLQEDVCSKCGEVSPKITYWVCENCEFINDKLVVECGTCGRKNENIMKCPQCKKNYIEKVDMKCITCSTGEDYVESSNEYASKKDNKINEWICEKYQVTNKEECRCVSINKDKESADLNNQPFTWKCSNCNVSVQEDACYTCGEVSPKIRKWVCENCEFINEKLVVECGTCGRKNENIMKCPQCKKNYIEKVDKKCTECVISDFDNVKGAVGYSDNKSRITKCKDCGKNEINLSAGVCIRCNTNKLGFWKCWRKYCGFENEPEKIYCQKCYVHIEKCSVTWTKWYCGAPYLVWVCETCEYLNYLSSDNCFSCGQPKYLNFNWFCDKCLIYSGCNSCRKCRNMTEKKWTCKECGCRNNLNEGVCDNCKHEKENIYFCRKCKINQMFHICQICRGKNEKGWFCKCGDFNLYSICSKCLSWKDKKWHCKVCNKEVYDYTCSSCLATGF